MGRQAIVGELGASAASAASASIFAKQKLMLKPSGKGIKK